MGIDVKEAGRRGGKISASKLTAKQRVEKARKAARARWSKKRTRPRER